MTLSSIKAPRMGGRDRPGEPYARESKEFLRQRLIGDRPRPLPPSLPRCLSCQTLWTPILLSCCHREVASARSAQGLDIQESLSGCHAAGKEVQVSMEYSRKVPFMANGTPLEGEAAGERQLDFGSVTIKDRAEGGQTRQNNVCNLSVWSNPDAV